VQASYAADLFRCPCGRPLVIQRAAVDLDTPQIRAAARTEPPGTTTETPPFRARSGARSLVSEPLSKHQSWAEHSRSHDIKVKESLDEAPLLATVLVHKSHAGQDGHGIRSHQFLAIPEPPTEPRSIIVRLQPHAGHVEAQGKIGIAIAVCIRDERLDR